MNTNEPTPRKPLRLWPGVTAAVLLVLIGYVVPIFDPEYAGVGMIGAALLGLIILLWWLLFSRARWYERPGAIALIILGAYVAHKYVVHPSISGGAQGYLTYALAIPTLAVALVAWAAMSRGLSPAARGAAAIVAVAIGCLPWTLVRTGGIMGSGRSDFHLRWTPTPEEKLLAQADEPRPRAAAAAPVETSRPAATVAPEATKDTPAPAAPAATPAAPAPAPAATKPAEWPGFRGPERDGVVHGVQIAADWSQSPPVQLWRRPIGPGWSSFAVNGNLIYTQEQRGGDEVVSCYHLRTGEPVWRHRDATRFWESNGGAGPRGTPTLNGGRVYSMGATGVVNVLDALTGAVVWSHNAAKELNAKVPFWGISSSPLVVDDVVIVAAGGKLAGYETATGHLRWSLGSGAGYSSPHLATIDGVQQVLFINGPGTTGVEPKTGKVLWQHAWEGGAIVQPAMTADGDVIVNAMAGAGGAGIRRIAIAHQGAKWTSAERWTSIGLKPYFNDFVLHKGFAYGFDNNILSCVDLQDGTRKWKGGRYGNGQLVLLEDQDLLLVLSEEGELALVKATPDQFTEVAKVPALEGKTWNHPVLVHDVLLVRNDHEMAAYRLTLAQPLTVIPSGGPQ